MKPFTRLMPVKNLFPRPGIIRIAVILCWMILTFSSWLMAVPPDSVMADDGNPAVTDQFESPVFPQSTPIPETETQPIYQVPLALNPHDHFYFIPPLSQDSSSNPEIGFRYAYYYEGEDKVHTGVDFAAPMRTPVLSAGDGKVIFSGYGLLNGGKDVNDPYGKAVMIKHNFSYEGKSIYTVYAHLDKITVGVGQEVKAGDQIGSIGMTGNTSGPHVHFEVRVEDSEGGNVQNPELWLAPTVGCGVLAGRFKNDFGYLMSSQTVYVKNLSTEKMYEILTYANEKNIFADDYYNENLVLGNLPAGEYQISLIYNYRWYRANITVAPGAVNYVFFDGRNGFSQNLPSDVSATDFLQ